MSFVHGSATVSHDTLTVAEDLARERENAPQFEPVGDAEIELRPRILVNGFPKSGLHLATLLARCVVTDAAVPTAWGGTFQLNAWSTEWLPATKVFPTLSRIVDNSFLKGHVGYSPRIEQYLFWHGVSMAFVFRDPRDVLVSQSFHVLADDDGRFTHPGKSVFRALATHEDVLLACLEGIGPYAGLFERWSLYANWLAVSWVFKLRFEDMRLRPDETARRFAAYVYERLGQANGLDVKLPEDVLDEAVGHMTRAMKRTELSPTFRKGNVGDWRDHFTPRVKTAFKLRAGDWLERLGYEDNDDW